MKRRQFLAQTITLLLANGVSPMLNHVIAKPQKSLQPIKSLQPVNSHQPVKSNVINVFLCGDVMLGRGIDQILPYPNEPQIFEPYIKNAKDYVYLAERQNGTIKKPVSFDYIWGDALQVLAEMAPDIRIINLETSVTSHNRYWPRKGIQYRMHPKNIPCISSANIDVCTLANNHILDWHYEGLKETLSSLKQAGIKTAGAGLNFSEAQQPAIKNIPNKGRVLVYSLADYSSGTPTSWKATPIAPGVNLLDDLSIHSVRQLAQQINEQKGKNDIAIASIHWGGNWGYEIDYRHRQFAHNLIDYANIDIIHGHSSHHPKGIEVYKDKPILYGCGDFLNDYEGISGHDHYRGELGFMYFVSMNADTGNLESLRLIPTEIKQLRVQHASNKDSQWLQKMLNREGLKLGTQVKQHKNNFLLTW